MKYPVLHYINTWLKKIIKTISIVLISLTLLISSSLFFLLGTDKGFNFLLSSASDLSSQAFTFSTVSGNFLDNLNISKIEYHDKSIQLIIKQLDLNWLPKSVVDFKIDINNLKVDGITFKQLQNTDTSEQTKTVTTSEQIKLPEINLPVDIIIKKIQFSDINFISSPATEAIYINNIELQADLINSQLNLHQLAFTMPEVQSNINGSITLLKDYSLSLQNNITLIIPQQDELKLSGKIQGDIKQLNIKQQINGLLDASLNASAENLLDKLEWQADLSINSFDLAHYINTTAEIDSKEINSENISAQIHLKGDMDNYAIGIKLDHSGIQLPDGQWQIDAEGNASQIEIKSMHGNLLDGTIDINSTIDWQNNINWQANVKTQNINPQHFHHEWPGSLNIDLQSSGQKSEEQLKASLILNNINGQLRQKPLSGGGEFDINNQHITINHLNLHSADAKLTANGHLGEQMDLNWSLDVTKLSDILPRSQGSIVGQGQISGSQLQPILSVDLKLQHIIYDTIKLNSAALTCTLNSNPNISSDLKLTAQELELDSQNIEKLHLIFNGPLEKHQINFMAQYKMAKLSIQANGNFNEEHRTWDGTISQILIDSTDFGKWAKNKASKISGSANKIVVSPLCLHEKTAELCTQVNWTAAKGSAELSLKNLSFDKAKPYLPEEIKQITGGFELFAHIELAPQILAHIKADIQPGELTVESIGQQPISLAHKNGLIEADYNNKELTANWNIEMGSHTLDGNINLPRKALDKDPMTAPIKGNINIDITELSIISALVPAITLLEGTMLANLTLAGTPEEPRIAGETKINASQVEIHDAGLQIKKLNLNIIGNNAGKELSLSGGMQSGDGEIKVQGQIELYKEKGFPLHMDIQGENFLAIDIPDAYAVISPNIQFSQHNGLMKIKGKIIIPEATIEPSGILEGSASTSDDVFIIGTEEKKPANLDLDISIELGDNIELDAFGLKSDVIGSLAIKQIPRQLMTASGELHLKEGTFRAYGQYLNIVEGTIFYAGGYLDNPGIKLTASRKVSDTEVGIKVSGSAKKPQIIPFSDDHTLREKDIVSMMLTGQNTENLDKASIYAGDNINEDLSVGVNAGMGDEATEFITRYKLTNQIELEGTSSSEKSGGGIFYTFELD